MIYIIITISNLSDFVMNVSQCMFYNMLFVSSNQMILLDSVFIIFLNSQLMNTMF